MIKNLNYELIGNNGPAIVFLHGWGMNKDAFNNVISLFDNDQLILKLDFFSFGNSDDVEDYFDTYEYAYHVFLLLKKLNLDEVYLVGHSFGGRISIILSSVFDVNICGCMLTSSAGLNRFDIKKSIKIISYKIAKFLCKKKILPCKILRRFGSNDYKNSNEKIRIVFVKIVNQDLLYLVKKINCHVSLVWDKNDDVTPYWICKMLYKTLMNKNIYLFNNGKHYVYLSNNNKVCNIIKNDIKC